MALSPIVKQEMRIKTSYWGLHQLATAARMPQNKQPATPSLMRSIYLASLCVRPQCFTRVWAYGGFPHVFLLEPSEVTVARVWGAVFSA